jgi:hypothetical protein
MKKLLGVMGVLATPLIFSFVSVAVPKVAVLLSILLLIDPANLFVFAGPLLVGTLLVSVAAGLFGGEVSFAITLF